MLISAVLPFLGLYYYYSGGAPIYWNADVCAMAIPFFTLGYLYKRYAKKIDIWVNRECCNTPIFILCAIVNVVMLRLSLNETGLGLDMFQSSYGNPFFTYIAAFAGIFAVVILSKRFTILPIQYIGENSMIYYVWHQTIMIPIISKMLVVMGLKVVLGK